MKVTVQPNGAVEIEVHNGDGQAALDMIRSVSAWHESRSRIPEGLRYGDTEAWAVPASEKDERATMIVVDGIPAPLGGGVRKRKNPVAALPPGLRATHEALDAYEAAHYSHVAKDLGIGEGAANQRLGKLVKAGAARRIASGIYTTEMA